MGSELLQVIRTDARAIALSYHTLETNAVQVREAQHWMAQVLADRDSTSPTGGDGLNWLPWKPFTAASMADMI